MKLLDRQQLNQKLNLKSMEKLFVDVEEQNEITDAIVSFDGVSILDCPDTTSVDGRSVKTLCENKKAVLIVNIAT